MWRIDEQRPGGNSGVAGLTWPPAGRARDWLGVFEDHEIRVSTRGLLRARLYLDGKLVDQRSPLLSRDRRVPLLSGRLPNAGPEVTLVHVYPQGLFPVKVEVRVGGKRVPMNPYVHEEGKG